MMHRENIVRSSFALTTARIVSSICGAAGTIILARWLGPDEYGLLALCITIVTTITLFADFGLSGSVARFLTEQLGAPSAARTILITGMTARFMLLAASCVLLWSLAPLICDFLKEPRLNDFFLLVLLLTVGMGTSKTLYSLFQATNSLGRFAGSEALRSIALLAVSLLLVALGLGVTGALIGHVTSVFLQCFVALVLLIPILRTLGLFSVTSHDSATQGDSWQTWSSRILRYGVPLILTSAGFFVYRQSDILMIQFFLGTDDVAFYHAQSRIVQMLHIPVIAVGASVAPYFSRGRIDLQSQRDIFQRCMHFILLLYVPAAVGMTLLAVPIIDLVYGVEFMPAASAFSVYTLLYTPSFAVAAVISLLLNYRGRAMHRAGIISVTALANIALNILLIPKFGIVGAAASTQLTYTPAVACYIYLATGDLGVSRAQILLGLRKILVATLVMAVAIFVLASAIPHPRVALTLIPIGAAVYFATARIVGAVTAEDISAFKGLFRKRRIEA